MKPCDNNYNIYTLTSDFINFARRCITPAPWRADYPADREGDWRVLLPMSECVCVCVYVCVQSAQCVQYILQYVYIYIYIYHQHVMHSASALTSPLD